MNEVCIWVQIIFSLVIIRNWSEKTAASITFSSCIIIILIHQDILIDLILKRWASLEALPDLLLSFKESVKLLFELQLLFCFEAARVFEPWLFFVRTNAMVETHSSDCKRIFLRLFFRVNCNAGWHMYYPLLLHEASWLRLVKIIILRLIYWWARCKKRQGAGLSRCWGLFFTSIYSEFW